MKKNVALDALKTVAAALNYHEHWKPTMVKHLKVQVENAIAKAEGRIIDRECKIISGSLEVESGAGDGAYDLLDVEGTPEEVGQAIGESLALCDIMTGGCDSILAGGTDLFLNLRIKISPILEE